MEWTREPNSYDIKDDKIEIITKPYTDLWQRTYYHFRNDNAPVLQMSTYEKYFSFIVKTEFDSKHRFGIYACSPENSSFKAIFTHMDITECKWAAHDGQQPDQD